MAVTRLSNSGIKTGILKYDSTLAGYPPVMPAPTAADGGTGSTATITFSAVSGATGYRAISSPGGFTGTGSSSPITVSGLSSGTAYTFQIQAQNSIGYGGLSAASNSVTPVAPSWVNAYGVGTTNSGAVYGQPSATLFSNGDIAVSGYYTSASGSFVTRIAPDGTVVWNTTIGASTALSLYSGACVDSSNNVFVVGTSANNEINIFKLNSSGVLQTQRRITHTTGQISVSGVFTNDTNVYITGTSPSFGNSNYDFVIYSYQNAALGYNGTQWYRHPSGTSTLFGGPGLQAGSRIYVTPANGASAVPGRATGAQTLVLSTAAVPVLQNGLNTDSASGGTSFNCSDITSDGTSLFQIGYASGAPKKMVLTKSALNTSTLDYQYFYTCSLADLEIKHGYAYGGYIYFSGQLDSLSPNQQIWGRIVASTGVVDVVRRITTIQWSGLESSGIKADNTYVYLTGGTQDNSGYSRPSVWRFKNDGSGAGSTFNALGYTGIQYTDITSTFTRSTSTYTMSTNNSYTSGSGTNINTSIPTFSTGSGASWTKVGF